MAWVKSKFYPSEAVSYTDSTYHQDTLFVAVAISSAIVIYKLETNGTFSAETIQTGYTVDGPNLLSIASFAGVLYVVASDGTDIYTYSRNNTTKAWTEGTSITLTADSVRACSLTKSASLTGPSLVSVSNNGVNDLIQLHVKSGSSWTTETIQSVATTSEVIWTSNHSVREIDTFINVGYVVLTGGNYVASVAKRNSTNSYTIVSILSNADEKYPLGLTDESGVRYFAFRRIGSDTTRYFEIGNAETLFVSSSVAAGLSTEHASVTSRDVPLFFYVTDITTGDVVTKDIRVATLSGTDIVSEDVPLGGYASLGSTLGVITTDDAEILLSHGGGLANATTSNAFTPVLSLYAGFPSYAPSIGSSIIDAVGTQAAKIPECDVTPCDNDSPYCDFPYTDNVYGTPNLRGGKVYFRQNKPGQPWYDIVSNAKGWTVDFSLEVLRIQNGSSASDTGEPDGVGLYVNDGTKQETIEFLTQEILFKNAGHSVSFDTTQETQYRLTCKNDELKLFARRTNSVSWRLLAHVSHLSSASNEGNGRRPAICEDANGVVHSVWHDDGNGVGQLLYSKFTDGAWSKVETVSSSSFSAQNADIAVDADSNVHVVYETQSTDFTTVAYVVRNEMGWGQPTHLSTNVNHSKQPKISIDANSVHIAWEDHRYGNPEILYIRKDILTGSFGNVYRVTNSEYGSVNPSITSYLDRAYVSYTKLGQSSLHIYASMYDIASDSWADEVKVSIGGENRADYSDIIAAMDGRLLIVWHDNGSYENTDIFSRTLNSNLVPVAGVQQITSTTKSASHPQLGLNTTTGQIHLVWEDCRLNDSDIDSGLDPYSFDSTIVDDIAHIYAAYYNPITSAWVCSETGSFDVRIYAGDNRTSTKPTIPAKFAEELHIAYESQMARSANEYLTQSLIPTQIRDAIYDLSHVASFLLEQDGDLQRDQNISTILARKEIRFGQFSDVVNGTYVFRNFRYYLKDAVAPFALADLSHKTFKLDELRVNDAVVNQYGDVWLATICGLYFYYQKENRIVEIQSSAVNNQTISSLVFDNNNVLFCAISTGVKYAYDHTNFTALAVSEITAPVRSLAVDKTNRLVIGTDSGAFIVSYVETTTNDDGEAAIGRDQTAVALTATVDDKFTTGEKVTGLAVDDNGVIWATTHNGLYRYSDGTVSHYTTVHGLATNWLNGIAVRNSAIRYIASAAGLYKMVGTGFERINAEDGNIYNNNVKSVVWQEPDIIWAGTLSKVNQIHESADGTYTNTVYDPADFSYFNDSLDDLSLFYIVTEPDEVIPANAEVEVYLNGNRVLHGFDVSLGSNGGKMIRFKTKLLPSDFVDVVIRKDITLMASFAQSDAEKRELGENIIRVKTLRANTNGIYLVTDGDENEVKVNDGRSPIPYDCVTIDTTPPTGCIEISEQINTGTVRVTIKDVTDGETGSGIDKIIVSNYPNFTTDGSTPQTPIPYTTSLVHDLLTSNGGAGVSLNLTSGTGSALKFFADDQTLYAASSKPAVLYKLNNSSGAWDVMVSYGSDEYLDVIDKINGKLIVGIGHDVNAAKLYIYTDGSFVGPTIRALSGKRIYCSEELLNYLYLGTGPEGNVYKFDGDEVEIVFSDLSTNVYSLTSSTSTLFAGTGEAGRIYRLDPNNSLSLIAHQDSDTAISSMGTATIGGKQIIFAGTSSEGKILRTVSTQDSFNVSFNTTESKVGAMLSTEDALYAAVGKAIYRIGEEGAWVWQGAAETDITGIALFDDELYYMTATGVSKITSGDEYFTVYLKMIDKAGNESPIYNEEGKLIACRFDSIQISDLQGIITENRILELDEVGNIVYTLSGRDKFFSADKVGEEMGIYDSQVFDGTNDLIKWDTVTWTANEPTGTSVELYFRTSVSSTDILTADWVGPYDRTNATQLDISFLSGQFIQFRAVLKSETKGVSPSLSRVVLAGLTAESTHFFTTNFVLPSRLKSIVLTSEKILPVSSEVVFGVNTTDSVAWSNYQIIDENRLNSIKSLGENMRIGIRIISPSRSTLLAAEFDEYGPYNSGLFINTVDFNFTNSGSSAKFKYRISLYSDANLNEKVFEGDSDDFRTNFSADGNEFPEGGKTVGSGETTSVIFSLPSSANVQCNSYYFVKVEAYNVTSESWETVSDNRSFITGCSPSFIDNIEFDFNNPSGLTDYHFRVRYYTDGERTTLYRTDYSGNNRSGWSVNGTAIAEEGYEVASNETVSVAFSPDISNFDSKTLYYLTIDAFDGTDFLLASNSYTFQVTDTISEAYCGPYSDVAVVKNFGAIVELLNNELITLNLR